MKIPERSIFWARTQAEAGRRVRPVGAITYWAKDTFTVIQNYSTYNIFCEWECEPPKPAWGGIGAGTPDYPTLQVLDRLVVNVGALKGERNLSTADTAERVTLIQLTPREVAGSRASASRSSIALRQAGRESASQRGLWWRCRQESMGRTKRRGLDRAGTTSWQIPSSSDRRRLVDRST